MRRAGALRALAGRGSAVDALVVAIAEPGGMVLSGDMGDPRALAERDEGADADAPALGAVEQVHRHAARVADEGHRARGVPVGDVVGGNGHVAVGDAEDPDAVRPDRYGSSSRTPLTSASVESSSAFVAVSWPSVAAGSFHGIAGRPPPCVRHDPNVCSDVAVRGGGAPQPAEVFVPVDARYDDTGSGCGR